ncbi:MAG: glutamate--tRNA ligase [Firmicutes bacterium]|nr:glutamate--tRNA ligase [Bacillota bacterium]
MDYPKLAELLFPDITTTAEDMEARYPKRDLPEGAMVTRMGPSPTGFIHLGNLYGALTDERLAHRSGGVSFLRIEDTDDKREVEGAVPMLIDALDYFGIRFDEGATADGETGDYGPYWQSERSAIYKTFVKKLVAEGKAYPCFMTEEEIADIRAMQEANKINPGIYGEYAKCRDLSYEEVEARLAAGEVPVMRLRSTGDPSKYFHVFDAIRGDISMPENEQDVVILKKTGLPTYHFAHVVDDHLMRTTHVVRGEEWIGSLPIHVELFQKLGWELPVYCHNTVLMKVDETTGTKRKLSKRKDPELGLGYYKELGYFPEAVREYLMTILNSDYEEWRMANPNLPLEDFPFEASKMSSSGTLFDLSKLNDISKDVLAKKSAQEIYDFELAWAKEFAPEKAQLLARDPEKTKRIFDIDRGGEKPRKDLIFAQQIFGFISYFFDETFSPETEMPAECSADDIREIFRRYKEGYSEADDNGAWFEKIRAITADLGYAVKPKDYKKNPDQYKGHVGHVSNCIRIALTGRSNSPDLWTIQQIMGKEQVFARLDRAEAALQ